MRVRVVSISLWDSPLKHVIQQQAQVTATAVITDRDQTTSSSCQWRGRWSLSSLSALQWVMRVPFGDAAIWGSIVRNKGTGKKSSTHFNCSAMPCSCNLSNKHFYLLLPTRKGTPQSPNAIQVHSVVKWTSRHSWTFETLLLLTQGLKVPHREQMERHQ